MRPLACLAAAGIALLAGWAPARADEPMQGTFRAARSCEALLSIRKGTNPGHVITGPGISYQLLARNQKQAATHYRIEVPDADPPERWVPVECGKVLPANPADPADQATAPAQPPARPGEPTSPMYWR